MSYHLLLDDIRNLEDVKSYKLLPNVESSKWIVVRSYKEFVDIITLRGVPQFVSLDHDLADIHYGHGLNNDAIPYDSYKEKTGYDCAKWLVGYCFAKKIKHPPYVVHSMNPIGKQNIESYINSYNKTL